MINTQILDPIAKKSIALKKVIDEFIYPTIKISIFDAINREIHTNALRAIHEHRITTFPKFDEDTSVNYKLEIGYSSHYAWAKTETKIFEDIIKSELKNPYVKVKFRGNLVICDIYGKI